MVIESLALLANGTVNGFNIPITLVLWTNGLIMNISKSTFSMSLENVVKKLFASNMMLILSSVIPVFAA